MMVRSGWLRITSVSTICFGADDQALAGARHLGGKAADAIDLGIAEFIGAVDVDQPHIQDQSRHQAYRCR